VKLKRFRLFELLPENRFSKDPSNGQPGCIALPGGFQPASVIEKYR
jgi:hypothetical protein